MNASLPKSPALKPARDDTSMAAAATDNRGSSRPGISSETFTFIVLIGLIAAMLLLSPFVSPSLGGWDQIGAILVLSSFLIVVAFGQQMVVLIGGLDLSVASTMTLGGILAFSWMSDSPVALVWGIPVVLVVTACVGALNGLGVTMLKVPPFIMTLAMGIIVYSVCLGYTGGTPRGQASPYLAQLFSTRVGGVAPILILMVVLIVAASLLQARTAFGRKLYAIGTSPVAAYMAGLKVKRLTVATYAISGAAAGLAGILMVGYAGGATLVMGQPYLMPSIAAIIVGGTSILGGRGIYPNAVAGAVLLTTFSTIISALQIAEAWRTIIYGLLILIAIMALRDEIYSWAGRLRWARVSRALVQSSDQKTEAYVGGKTMNLKRLGRSLMLAASVATMATASLMTVAKAADEKIKIYLSLSYSGNAWQSEAANVVKALAATPPYDKIVDLQEMISGADVQAQLSAYQSMVASGAKGIISFPISSTGLNRAIHAGCEKGVLFFFYDGAVTEPCAYNVSYLPMGFGENTAQALVNALGGKGKIFLSRGVAGNMVDKRHTDGAMAVFKRYPDIKVVAEYYGMWNDQTTQSETAKALAAHPDVDGIWAQAGENGAVKAVLASGRDKLPAITGENSNGFRLALANPEFQKRGLTGVSSGSPPASSGLAFKLMMEMILKGKKLETHNIAYPLPWVPASDVKLCTGDKFENGCNTFPEGKVPDSMVTQVFEDKWLPELSLQSALDGKPTPGATIQPLPDDAVQSAPNVPGINCAKCEAAKDPYPLTKVKATVEPAK